MSVRTSILNALVAKLNTISIVNGYKTDLVEYAHSKLKFWDECVQYPAIFSTTGSETREYLPGGFKWGFLGISLKIYVKSETSAEDLEKLLEDVVTDEGLLEPYGVGEINLTVQYPVL
jgi:hypothetical protein